MCNSLVSVKDLLGRTLGDTAGTNLFTPDFGLSPCRIVGRDGLLGDLKDGLGAGPRDPRFTSVIVGHRGTGKTILLNETEDVAAQAGWVIVSVDATTSGLYSRIDDEIRSLVGPAADRISSTSAGPDTEITLSAGVASVSRRLGRGGGREASVSKKLELLAGHAADRGSAVLLSVDELQAGRREELRRLAADLQHITKRRLLPLAFVGAGLPVIEYTIMRDNKMTFFQRCHDHQLEALADDAVVGFYRQAISDAGGRCSAANLERMAAAADGIAYKMQLIGDSAWVLSGAPRAEIDETAVEMAIRAAEKRMRARVYSHIWGELSDTDKDILRTIAMHGGSVSRRELGAALVYSASHVVHRMERLAKMGCLAYEPGAEVTLGPLTPAPFVAEIAEAEASVASGRQAPAEFGSATVSQSAGRRCGKQLKTVDRRCVLRQGHNGRCRSR